MILIDNSKYGNGNSVSISILYFCFLVRLQYKIQYNIKHRLYLPMDSNTGGGQSHRNWKEWTYSFRQLVQTKTQG